ncbi:MAG: hypothetical protein J6C18_11955 [Bacteroidaceae bacterium]|nr:hypothetical protein [Bacteroidaceae bacterium]
MLSAQFKEYKAAQKDKFEEYRKQLNAEYAEYMRQAWTEYKPCPPKPVPPRKEPPKPVVKTPEEPATLPVILPVPQEEPVVEPAIVPAEEPTEEPAEPIVEPETEPVAEPEEEDTDEPEEVVLPFDEVVPLAEPAQPVVPGIPLPEVTPVVTSVPGHTFSYYGTSCKIAGMNSTHRFVLAGVKEEHVADAWVTLAADKYLSVLAQCAEYREKLNLCDWGYVRFLQEMTTSFFTASHSNEAVLMQIYLLVQSGYRVRMARSDNGLVLLLPIEHDVYDYSYLTVDGIPYYIIDDGARSGRSFYVYDRAFPQEMALSLYMPSPPSLQAVGTKTVERTLTSKKQVSVTVETDRNLIDFYNDYPVSSQWGFYSSASLSQEIKSELYPTLRHYIDGMGSAEAANLLLNFVQTAFEYKTDDEQFGYERPLFGDETFFYPYCDCEDRSILYSILVRDLLGLDVVLLNYPGHLATAVKFKEDVIGDYILLNDGKYIVCDPTYIGAGIGEAMPDCRDEKAVIVRI